MDKPTVLIICGPTSSGKTSLAITLARKIKKCSILSVDSRQVYRDLDIITGKDIPNDLPEEVKIFGLNLWNPDQNANLAEFTLYAWKIINDEIKKGRTLIIVGGTGLYLKALTHKLSSIFVPPNPYLRNRLETLKLNDLQSELLSVSPDRLNSMNDSDRKNPRRLIRAIEVAEFDSHRSSHLVKSAGSLPDINFLWVGLKIDKDILEPAITSRVIDRINAGAIEEVTKLINKYPDKKLPIYSSLGVAQIKDYIEGRIDKETLIKLWASKEMDYARRQVVWFKKQPDIIWYDKHSNRTEMVTKILEKIKPHA